MHPDTKQLIEHQLQQYQITDTLASSSIVKYRCSLKRFFSMIDRERFDQINLADFDTFILRMKENGAGNSRIANVISAVKRVLGDLKKSGLVNSSIILDEIKKPKIPKRPVSYLTNDEVAQFLKCILDDMDHGLAIRKVRMMALVILLLQTGARIGEALSIKTNDIDRINLEIPIIGKGNKPRKLFLKEEVIHWLDQYLKIRKGACNYVFTTLDGKSRWSQTDVGRSFRRYRRLSGIQKHFTPHTFRHTFATSLAFDNVSFSIVQALLGHSNLETTIKYYIGPVEQRQARKVIKDQHFNFIPQAKLSDRASNCN